MAFIGAAEDDELWPILSATAERYREGLEGLELTAQAPKVRSADEQLQLVRSLQVPGLRGLCIQPVDPDALRDLLCELQTKGVVVVTMLQPVRCTDPLPYSGLDNLAIGEALADVLVAELAGKGSIAVLTDSNGSQAVHDRLVGFHERMRQAPGIGILRELDCDGSPVLAERLIREYLERFPRLDAWVAVEDWPLREHPRDQPLLTGGCRLVMTGIRPKYWAFLSDGTCAALVGAEYERVAESALRMCMIAIQGEPLPIRTYLAPPVTVTTRNLNWYRAKWFEARKRPERVSDEIDAIETQDR